MRIDGGPTLIEGANAVCSLRCVDQVVGVTLLGSLGQPGPCGVSSTQTFGVFLDEGVDVRFQLLLKLFSIVVVVKYELFDAGEEEEGDHPAQKW